MKRFSRYLVSIFMVITLSLLLFACGGKSKKDKNPTTDYDKVEFAFKGVEKSFSNSKKTSGTNEEGNNNLLSATNVDGALSELNNIYTPGDSQGDVIDELEYDQPPMIQFQCLKTVLEKIGKNYSFGTKYYNDMTGTMYFDINTGYKVEESNEYKYNYSFRMAMGISIDSNDLIKADVSFDIRLEKDNQTINTNWYVLMELDYDMNKTTPNYELTMYTVNNQIDLPFRNVYTYEYDYVKVIDNKINEWRKLGVHSNQELVIDQSHNSIDSYLSDDNFDYSIVASKWYKNNDLRKITQMNNEKKYRLANSFYMNLGMNSTDTNSSSFVNKNGIVSDVIKQLYTDMASIFKQDVIYSLVCDDEDEDSGGGEDGNVLDSISIKTADNQSYFENRTLNQDPTLAQMFENSTTYFQDTYPVIHLTWRENGRDEVVSDLNNLVFSISIANENARNINLNDKISSKLLEFNSSSTIDEFTITITYPNTNISSSTVIYVGQEINDIVNNGSTTVNITDLGFPECSSGNIKKYGDEYKIEFQFEKDFNIYLNTLEYVGFEEVNYGRLAKIYNDSLLYVNMDDYYNNGSLNMLLQVKDRVKTTLDTDLVDRYLGNVIKLQAPSGQNALYEYVTDGDDPKIIVYGLSQSERNAYLSSLVTDSIIYVEGIGYRIKGADKYYEYTIGECFATIVIPLTYKQCNYLDIKFRINDGEEHSFTPDLTTYTVTYNSDEITLHQNDVLTFTGTGLNSISVNSSDYSVKNGTRVTYNISGQYKYVVNIYSGLGEDGDLPIQFLYVSSAYNPKE